MHNRVCTSMVCTIFYTGMRHFFSKSGKISLVFAGIFVRAEESAAVLFRGRPLLEDMNRGVDSQAVCF